MNKKNCALFAACLLLCAYLASPVAVFAEQEDSVRAMPVLVVEGNTIYVDATESSWNSLQGTVQFDPANEVAEYGQTDEFVNAIAEQKSMGFQATNVTEEGEFIFAAAYTATSGEGVSYEGHIFYITFADTSAPIDVTLYDDYNYEMLTATVDGSPEAVTYAADEATLNSNEEQRLAAAQAAEDADTDAEAETDADAKTQEEKSDSSGKVWPIVVVVIVVVLAVAAVLVSKKNGEQDKEKAADGQAAPNNTPDQDDRE